VLERLLLPELREAVLTRDWKGLAELCSVIHPSIISQMLVNLEDIELEWATFEHIDPMLRTQIFEYLPEEIQDALVARLPIEELADLLEMMAHDERVDIVKRMDEEHQALTMPLVARAEREDILRLVQYEEGTAGSIMTTDYAAIRADLEVHEALTQLRREAPNRETIYYIYVLDNQRRLIGIVSLKDLILALPSKKIAQIMREDVVLVNVDLDVETVARELAEYDLLAVPVVDNEQRLVGIITHDDVIDVVIEEATEDAQLMGAVQPLGERYLDSPFWLIVRKRVVWLCALFFAEMTSVYVLDSYEHGLFDTFKYVALFIPIIMATGGNSGSQGASLVTRSIALGELGLSDWYRVAVRELLSGIVLGAIVGLIGIATVVWLGHPAEFAMVLILSLIAVTTSGSLVGSLMPLVFKRLGMDPAVASGPFIASLVDVVGIFIYCSIALAVLSKFQ
jgi:magnesium transporter